MRALTYLSTIIVSFLTLNSCLKDDCTLYKEYAQYEPVYITQAEFDAPVEYKTVRPMESTGTIFAYGRYIFVNEFQKGIHIIDNQVPSNPKTLGFIEVTGNTHFTIKNDILYANKLEDLVAIDISDINHPKQVNRLPGVFQLHRAQTSSQGILAYYETTNETLELDCNDNRYNSLMFSIDDRVFFDFNAGASVQLAFASANQNSAAKAESGSAPVTLGVGGSMARFTTMGDRLYILSDFSLETVDISSGQNPEKMGTTDITFNAETIYPFGNYLYIGTTNGMHIYSISATGIPEHVSTTGHLQSCDPVIADDSYAYVTLRGGTECGGFTNQLEAYDLENQLSPKLIQTYPMENPHGLTKIGDYLYVCEGIAGWKKVKSNLPGQFTTEITNTDHSAFDVLVTPQSTLLFVGRKGIYQYDLSGSTPKLSSEIEFVLP